MEMPMLRCALALIALLPVPALATGSLFPTLNLPVNRVSAAQFEVIEMRGAGPRDIWCAAARYATGTLGQQRGRIYIDRPRANALTAQGRKGVVFTTQAPANAAPTGVSVTTARAGASLPVAHAMQFCRDRIIEPDDLF